MSQFARSVRGEMHLGDIYVADENEARSFPYLSRIHRLWDYHRHHQTLIQTDWVDRNIANAPEGKM
ncbi:hypothetical protein [Bacteroides thetaiotaomicron]|uniref:hypothetical protein n=1 Tax=Bacteroides thetaiotaomicron TaxID=818 RepID=UPI00286DFF7B|nr:hypothetical protein [Bacteroides thetaiotaomicron]MCS2264247.1 hypothetical protein [Bacteroides thetaiotaomicron]